MALVQMNACSTYPPPQVLRAFDVERLCLGGPHQRLCGQQVQIAAGVLERIVAAAEFEPQYLRQPARQGAIGLDFMLRCALSC